MKSFVQLLLLSGAALLSAAEPFRAATELEKKLAAAKAEYYRNYDKIEAHFKFAGVLFDAGCLESAFGNAECLLRSAADGNVKPFFERSAKRPLIPLFTDSERKTFAKFPREQQLKTINQILQKKSEKAPLYAEYSRFSGDPERWNSRNPQDIAFVKKQIAQASASGKFNRLLDYNSAVANYLYLAAKDYENALPCFIKLYFHDPEYSTALQAPLGYTIKYIMQLLTPLRTSRAEVLSRRDPVKLVIENMHTHPRTVEYFLRNKRKEFSPEKFVKLCLLASDSVDLQLRSFAVAELMRRNLTPLLPLLEQLIYDEDAGRRAIAVFILPCAVPADKLPEALAELARDESAIVKMSVENVAKVRCSAENYTKIKNMLK